MATLARTPKKCECFSAPRPAPFLSCAACVARAILASSVTQDATPLGSCGRPMHAVPKTSRANDNICWCATSLFLFHTSTLDYTRTDVAIKYIWRSFTYLMKHGPSLVLVPIAVSLVVRSLVCVVVCFFERRRRRPSSLSPFHSPSTHRHTPHPPTTTHQKKSKPRRSCSTWRARARSAACGSSPARPT